MQAHAPPNCPQLSKVVFVLMLGTFAMGNAKFSIIPLIPTIASDFNASNSEVFEAVFAYFWGAFIGAPILALLFRNWSKPKILALLSIWCFLGNFLTSFATNPEVLYWLRWFSSIPHAAFMAFATLLICETAPVAKRGLYLGCILLGLSISTIFVVPFNAYLGMQHGWEISFRFVALLDLLIFLLVLDLLPKAQTTNHITTISQQLKILTSSHLWFILILALCVITAASAAWSFGLAWLNRASPLDFPIKVIATVTLGMGFVIGQLAGGWAADQNVNRYIGMNSIYTLLSLLFLFACLFDYRLGLLGIFFIAISFAAINVMAQVNVLQFPATSLYLSMCLFNAIIQLGNFLGSGLSNMALTTAHPIVTITTSTLTLAALSCVLWLCMNKLHHNTLKTH